jgi:hypothetical protein
MDAALEICICILQTLSHPHMKTKYEKKINKTNKKNGNEILYNTSQSKASSPEQYKVKNSKDVFLNDCKPNINDLKQIFDINNPNKRYNNNLNRLNKMQSASQYYDARISYIDIESSNSKSQSPKNMFDFESAKQKFTHASSSRSFARTSSTINSARQSNIPKRTTYNAGPSNLNITNESQYFVIGEREHERIIENSLNLDDLKVSSPEEDVSKNMFTTKRLDF